MNVLILLPQASQPFPETSFCFKLKNIVHFCDGLSIIAFLSMTVNHYCSKHGKAKQHRRLFYLNVRYGGSMVLPVHEIVELSLANEAKMYVSTSLGLLVK